MTQSHHYIIYTIITIILLFLLHYIKSLSSADNTSTESFTTDAPNQPSIQFIESTAIFQSNFADYISHMNQINIQARGFINAVDLMRAYTTDSVQPISADERKYIESNIVELRANIAPALATSIMKLDIKLAKSAEWLEGGMPHTHCDLIIMPARWFQQFNGNTLIHELTHIHQRAMPSAWYELVKLWGFVQYNVSMPRGVATGLEGIIARNRVNPDGLDINYLWRPPNSADAYWIGAVYRNITPTNIVDNIEYVACKMVVDNTGDVYKYTGVQIELAQFKEFQQFFGRDIHNNYHPMEIGADYMCLFQREIGKNENRTKGYEIFKKWCVNL